MNIVLPAVIVAFAALCIWLTVRIINRREIWAKWTLAAVIGVPALYPLSFGPACWVTSRLNFGAHSISVLYRPIEWTLGNPETSTIPSVTIAKAVRWYAKVAARPDWEWTFTIDAGRPGKIVYGPWEWGTGNPYGSWERKDPGVAFWATVVVVVALVAYPLSWGPACWIITRIGDPPWALEVYWKLYAPILWLDQHSPAWVQDATEWYCGLVPPR
jgi:hypothetical protein